MYEGVKDMEPGMAYRKLKDVITFYAGFIVLFSL